MPYSMAAKQEHCTEEAMQSLSVMFSHLEDSKGCLGG